MTVRGTVRAAERLCPQAKESLRRWVRLSCPFSLAEHCRTRRGAGTSLPLCAAQMNDVALCANDVLRNDVVTVCKQTASNDVALLAS